MELSSSSVSEVLVVGVLLGGREEVAVMMTVWVAEGTVAMVWVLFVYDLVRVREVEELVCCMV